MTNNNNKYHNEEYDDYKILLTKLRATKQGTLYDPIVAAEVNVQNGNQNDPIVADEVNVQNAISFQKIKRSGVQ